MLTGLFQGRGKVFHRGKARFRVFGQSLQYDLLDLWWDCRHALKQREGRHAQVLSHHLARRPLKGTLATQPLVDHHPQRILITCRAWVSLDLLRSHVG